MKKYISKKTGKWLAIGGGVTFVVSMVIMFAVLLPAYGMLGTCNAGSCATSLDTRGLVVRVASWAVIASMAAILAGVIVLLLAKTSEETRHKK